MEGHMCHQVHRRASGNGKCLALGVTFILSVGQAQGELPLYTQYTWRGDSNGDGLVDSNDAVTIAEYLFNEGTLACQSAADANDDGDILFSDIGFILFELCTRECVLCAGEDDYITERNCFYQEPTPPPKNYVDPENLPTLFVVHAASTFENVEEAAAGINEQVNKHVGVSHDGNPFVYILDWSTPRNWVTTSKTPSCAAYHMYGYSPQTANSTMFFPRIGDTRPVFKILNPDITVVGGYGELCFARAVTAIARNYLSYQHSEPPHIKIPMKAVFLYNEDPPANVTVDNLTPTSSAWLSTTTTGTFGPNSLYTTMANPSTAYVFHATLQSVDFPSYYSVDLWWPIGKTYHCTDMRVEFIENGQLVGMKESIDQSKNCGQWYFLGRYKFNTPDVDVKIVALQNYPYKTFADAVRFRHWTPEPILCREFAKHEMLFGREKAIDYLVSLFFDVDWPDLMNKPLPLNEIGALRVWVDGQEEAIYTDGVLNQDPPEVGSDDVILDFLTDTECVYAP
jgi:hypothetical protein